MAEAVRGGLVAWCVGGMLAALSARDGLMTGAWSALFATARAQDVPSVPAEGAGGSGAGERYPLDLRPQRAARSLLWDEGAPQSATLSAVSGTEEAELEARLAAQVPELSRVGHDDTGAAVEHGAQDLTAALLRPWQLLFAPLRAARYRYRGGGFDAVIRSDGHVAYRDKDGAHLTIIQIERPNGEPGKIGLGLGSGDPRRWIEKLAGNDPQAGERRSFLARTRGLRELLNARARREAERRADAWLGQRLARIVASAGDTQAKRDAVFALWDQCADDDIGAVGRARIEAFVRRQCPRSSECSFSVSDLERLNRRRDARGSFDPYATPTRPAAR